MPVGQGDRDPPKDSPSRRRQMRWLRSPRATTARPWRSAVVQEPDREHASLSSRRPQRDDLAIAIEICRSRRSARWPAYDGRCRIRAPPRHGSRALVPRGLQRRLNFGSFDIVFALALGMIDLVGSDLDALIEPSPRSVPQTTSLGVAQTCPVATRSPAPGPGRLVATFGENGMVARELDRCTSAFDLGFAEGKLMRKTRDRPAVLRANRSPV